MVKNYKYDPQKIAQGIHKRTPPTAKQASLGCNFCAKRDKVRVADLEKRKPKV